MNLERILESVNHGRGGLVGPVDHTVSILTDADLHLFNEGRHFRLYEKLGAHPSEINGVSGTFFSIWAPDAEHVSVIGDFNGWNRGAHGLSPRGFSGIWSGFIPGVTHGARYKYFVKSRHSGYESERSDPFGFFHEMAPRTASVVWDWTYHWSDSDWMSSRRGVNSLDAPMSIYEVHLGSWQRVPEEGNRWLSYRELAPRLANYVREMNFTHVQLLPIMEHPFYGSWGYQCTGFFAPTSRYGTPEDLKYLIEHLHHNGIGVILDWVPSHFPSDGHGLAYLDGTHLYEHADPREGYHPDWNSYIFNYGRNEVRSFLLSSALFWLDRFHADGIRVDAVASMLYRNYSRKDGEWIPNRYGGKENIEAIDFLRQFNEEVYRHYPDVQTFAEESTSWGMVSRPTHVGGLGFGMKWDMGWMHDTLKYMQQDPVHRKYHHNLLSFRMLYAFHENFVLPLSHDEVVHGKGSLLGMMPGDLWQKFANLRLLFGYMFAQPGKKLLFMGCEFGQWWEWYHEKSLDWHLLEHDTHRGLRRWVEDLNRTYRSQPALHQCDFDWMGFRWIDCNDSDNSVITLERRARDGNDAIVVAANFTPVPRHDYRVGVGQAGYWREILNSDASAYGGSNCGNGGGVDSDPVPVHGRPHSLNLTLPPLGVCFFRR